MNQYNRKTETVFAALAGVLYTFFGLIHITEGIGISSGFANGLYVSGDILGGFCLVVIGAVFLCGIKELLQGNKCRRFFRLCRSTDVICFHGGLFVNNGWQFV